MGLAGACRFSMAPLFVGAPLLFGVAARPELRAPVRLGGYVAKGSERSKADVVVARLCNSSTNLDLSIRCTSSASAFHAPHAFFQAGAAAAQPTKEQCGDFAEDCFRCKRKFRQSSATGAAPLCSRATNFQEDRGGSGGKHFFASPPAALRRFRRTKAAPFCKSILHGRKCISTKQIRICRIHSITVIQKHPARVLHAGHRYVINPR